MGNKMLIDAAHPEETRVVVVNGNRVEEFDFESENRKQLRGNIYLAKVTRVEPSLQAAFVEYGGNRHGFLAFGEIHPDYYQIPVADREALLRQQAAEARREEEEHDEEAGSASSDKEQHPSAHADTAAEHEDAQDEKDPSSSEDASSSEDEGEAASEAAGSQNDAPGDETGHADNEPLDETESVHSDQTIEVLGSEDAMEEVAPRKQRNNFRSYKIQEVVKRRQILLVQVVKEERGNKGAALTTYLSLAGRYCVLMPNTARGGGISRKITQATDRKKLKSIAESLDVPEGMGLIVRTAGAKRTKVEIRRDYEYLLRMWESVRELTLRSTAPTLVYEEGSLIKRAIRDLYDKDIDSVLIEGDEGYKEAKTFMRMLMPSHAKNVQPFKDKQPLFQKFQVEQQLDSMFNPTVTLRSGGYVVINPTEALVSIDVNSGRSTKERNIEQTALRTNLEAAEEIARQMRLRDLAGLIVIDFIDMDENRNNKAVERKLKECLKNDRARIQVGRISHFGLLEMSRQRMRSGVLEGSTVQCPMCSGTGLVRSVESMALHVLRGIEAEATKGREVALTARVPAEVAIYILNQKRSNVLDIEERYSVSVYIETDHSLKGSEHRVEGAEARARTRTRPAVGAINVETAFSDEDPVIEEEIVETEEDEDDAISSEGESAQRSSDERDDADGEGGARRKRRRRRRRGRGSEAPRDQASAPQEISESEEHGEPSEDGEADIEEAAIAAEDGQDPQGEGEGRRRRRRGRRGGRRNRKDRAPDEESDSGSLAQSDDSAEAPVSNAEGEQATVLLSYSRNDVYDGEPSTPPSASEHEPDEDTSSKHAPAVEEIRIVERVSIDPALVSPDESGLEPEPEAVISGESTEPSEPPRRGWWQRR